MSQQRRVRRIYFLFRPKWLCGRVKTDDDFVIFLAVLGISLQNGEYMKRYQYLVCLFWARLVRQRVNESNRIFEPSKSFGWRPRLFGISTLRFGLPKCAGNAIACSIQISKVVLPNDSWTTVLQGTVRFLRETGEPEERTILYFYRRTFILCWWRIERTWSKSEA